MKSKIYSTILTGLVALLLLLGTGLIRDKVFTNLNKKIQTEQGPEALKQHFKGDSSILLKWFLTFLFTGLYLGISLFAIRFIFHDKLFLKITFFTFFILFGISLFTALGGLILGEQEKGYHLAREMAGIVQSPMPLMILIPAFYLFQKKQTQNIQG